MFLIRKTKIHCKISTWQNNLKHYTNTDYQGPEIYNFSHTENFLDLYNYLNVTDEYQHNY